MIRNLLTLHCVLGLCGIGLASDHPWAARRLNYESLPNAYQVNSHVISGGVPDGDNGFEQLRRLGVKTIISVDGAKPDLKRAKSHGLSYVHVPHGYDGISESQSKALAKAVLELPGPIYIHCHHGKHRSPAAAIVACIGAGLAEPGSGTAFLRAAGTSERYVGLYEAARLAKKLDRSDLGALQISFSETAQVTPLARAMVDIERTFDRLRQSRESGWRSPRSHPDLMPAHEALILKEHFVELLRLRSERRPEDYRGMLTRSRDAAMQMVTTLNQQPLTPQTASALTAAMRTIKSNCQQCHRRYRDVPTR